MEIIRIPAKKSLRKQRVAVYCRVSTRKEEQEDSLEIQEKYYRDLISLQPNWVSAGVYADVRSGLSAEKRPEFMRMIDDALSGKIDRILCKSVSRFSRNIVEFRKYLDMLKVKDVAVEFEKEHVKTDEPSVTFTLSLMSVAAENESRSISENVKLGYSYRYKRSEYNMGNNRIFGYDSVDGKLVPNVDAPIVKEIFEDFADGKSILEISRDLYAKEFHSRYQNAPCFNTIRYMLTNETYMGDKVLWKTTPRDLFTKKRDPSQKRDSINLPSDHEAIVDLETWNRVQDRLNKMDNLNKKVGHLAGTAGPFFGKFFCAKCGAPLTRRTYTTRKKTTYKAWVCRNRLRNKKLMKLVLEERIAHGGHPVLRWMMDNVYVRTDPAGNIKMDKEKSTKKIDGAVATVMALDRAIRCGNDTSESVYDTRGFLFFDGNALAGIIFFLLAFFFQIY